MKWHTRSPFKTEWHFYGAALLWGIFIIYEVGCGLHWHAMFGFGYGVLGAWLYKYATAEQYRANKTFMRALRLTGGMCPEDIGDRACGLPQGHEGAHREGDIRA